MDLDLIWIKLVHFIGCLANVGWGRYQVVYLDSRGHSPTNNGILRAGGLMAKFIFTPLWGASADSYPPTYPLIASVTITTLLMEFYRVPLVYKSFWALLLLKIVRSGSNGIGTLVDILTLRTIEHKHNAGYGSQRLWSGVAWGGGSFLVGFVIDRYGYEAMFYWTYLLSMIMILLLVFKPTSVTEVSHAEQSKKRSLGTILSSFAVHAHTPKMRQFLLMMVLYGTAMSLVETVMFLQLERDFNAPKQMMGEITMMGTMIEFPLFHFSKDLLHRFGHGFLFRVSHFMLAVRLLLLSQITSENFHLIRYIQLSHGVCFALGWISAVDYGFITAPANLKATSQSAVSLAYYIVGAGLGSVVFTTMYDHVGASLSYKDKPRSKSDTSLETLEERTAKVLPK